MQNKILPIFIFAVFALLFCRASGDVFPASANPGQTATFSVSLTAGSLPLSYQWRKNGTAIAGATATTYVVTGIKAADAGNYDVIVSNSAGSATSNEGVLTVNAGPVITQQPVSSQVINLGSPASFTVAATGAPAPTYQWRKNGVAIPGATSAAYTIAAVSLADAANYDCVITNSAGSVTSTPCALSAASVIPAGPALRIVVGPSGG